MKKTLLILIFPLVSCTIMTSLLPSEHGGPVSSNTDSSVIEQATLNMTLTTTNLSTPKEIASTPLVITPLTRNPTITSTISKTSTPKRNMENVNLTEIILSQEEIIGVLGGDPSVFSSKKDTTSELNGICFVDCIKVVYSGDFLLVSISLLRSFTLESAHEFIVEEYNEIKNDQTFEITMELSIEEMSWAHAMEGTWAVSGQRTRQYIDFYVGTYTGPFIVLVFMQYDWCDMTGEMCEADVGSMLRYTIDMAKQQVEKINMFYR